MALYSQALPLKSRAVLLRVLTNIVINENGQCGELFFSRLMSVTSVFPDCEYSLSVTQEQIKLLGNIIKVFPPY